ncbi:hypothetical protein [Paraferrimonas sedimenticola]|uniref:hypothetical protein n=1 Tax=Paraferrimonas sedimenticola TaxID=375674 RepID=UPI0011410535|nr:hypothetical protein [Paraferrimonas sedimenticola]
MLRVVAIIGLMLSIALQSVMVSAAPITVKASTVQTTEHQAAMADEQQTDCHQAMQTMVESHDCCDGPVHDCASSISDDCSEHCSQCQPASTASALPTSSMPLAATLPPVYFDRPQLEYDLLLTQQSPPPRKA